MAELKRARIRNSTPPKSPAASTTAPRNAWRAAIPIDLQHGEKGSGDAQFLSAHGPTHLACNGERGQLARVIRPIGGRSRAAHDQNVPGGALREPPATPVAHGADS
ncbi:hypothetical protein [Methylosinus sp. KRF6]|uniref:hypothetical protein n=1 Tax=Methylosinus sp. KRF6 TaxID=2846853 RepID=UPI001C0CC965|nr:hypothetical protein [Methylosinus sp. KRF6]MBU3888031.1 hypothetical protein [Methylosinus sp. KRF6]